LRGREWVKNGNGAQGHEIGRGEGHEIEKGRPARNTLNFNRMRINLTHLWAAAGYGWWRCFFGVFGGITVLNGK